MVEVVGVRFKRAGKIYYFTPGELELATKDKVIVETARGIEYGEIVIPLRQMKEEDVIPPLKPVIRKATSDDEQIVEQNKAKQKDSFQICLKKIVEHQLPMKLVDVEYTFDGNKIIFSFTAEGRVDFRELVKDLAAIFRTRIELRQIGVRDEAKMLGGIGTCGRELCCTTFLGEFEPVSIRMAKDQNLSLNPTKISGCCGRLMCCLKFESDCHSSTGCDHKQGNGAGAKQTKKLLNIDGIEVLDDDEAESLAKDENNSSGQATSPTNKKGDKPRGKSERQ